MLKFYCNPLSPLPRRVPIALLVAKLGFDLSQIQQIEKWRDRLMQKQVCQQTKSNSSKPQEKFGFMTNAQAYALKD
ncbi:MAG TPA: hypothetical protein V6C71_25470 [Coleofasciculaceae cyanobacterium]|jgi:hypothetical protein